MDSESKISTHVDALIEFLRSQKVVELSKAAYACGLGIKDAERWAHVLEDRGLLEVEYKLTRTYLVWKGKREAQAERKEGTHEAQEGAKETSADASIPEHLETPPESEKESEQHALANEEIEKESPQPELDFPKAEFPHKKERRTLKKGSLGSSADALKRQISAIEDEKQKISSLKARKEKLLEEVYMPIERRLDSQVKAISEKLLEKEKTILSLQQRAMEIPGGAQELEGNLLNLARLEKEAKKSFEDARTRTGDSLTEIRRLQEEAGQRLSGFEKSIFAGQSRLSELEKTLAKVQDSQARAEGQIEKAKEALKSQIESLDAAQTASEELANLKDELSSELSASKDSLERQKSEIKSISGQISRLAEVDRWVLGHMNEYSRKLEEFEKFGKESQESFDSLRETVETNFVRRYLDELKDAMEANRFEAMQAKRSEEEIDRQIQGSKRKISQLIEEAKEIVDTAEESASFEPENTPDIQLMESRGKRMYGKMAQINAGREKVLMDLENAVTGGKDEQGAIELPKTSSPKKKTAGKLPKSKKETKKKRK